MVRAYRFAYLYVRIVFAIFGIYLFVLVLGGYILFEFMWSLSCLAGWRTESVSWLAIEHSKFLQSTEQCIEKCSFISPRWCGQSFTRNQTRIERHCSPSQHSPGLSSWLLSFKLAESILGFRIYITKGFPMLLMQVLDEVQSYILLSRHIDSGVEVPFSADRAFLQAVSASICSEVY